MTTASPAIRRASNPSLPTRLWIADLAPLSVLERPLFLGVVLDCCSSRCLGWRFTDRLEPALISGAVEDALSIRSPLDRTPLGRPVALALADRCAAADVGLPSEGLEPGDRRVSSDFFNWLGADVLATADWQAADQARRAIRDWIIGCYNLAVTSPPIPSLDDSAIPEEAEGAP